MESGHLRLAVCSTGKHFAPRMLGAFLGRYPGVEVALEIHNRKTLLDRLAGNEDDLYVFASALDRDDVVTQALLPNPLVVFARDDHPLAAARHMPHLVGDQAARGVCWIRRRGLIAFWCLVSGLRRWIHYFGAPGRRRGCLALPSTIRATRRQHGWRRALMC